MTPPRRRLGALALGALVLLGAACSSSGDADALRVAARIGDRPLAEAQGRDPVRIDPGASSVLALTVVNQTDAPVTVSHLRLEGELLGLTFLTYDVRVLLDLEPGASRSIEVPLDFFDLDSQAHGYLRTHLRLYDEDRQLLASEGFAVDVRGRPLSTMSVFALLLLAITAATAAFSLRDLARRTLPAHRMARGVRFAVPGLGVGLLLAAGSSILRLFPLPDAGSVPIVVVATAAGFAAGYLLTPAPVEDDDALEDDDLDEALPVP